MDSKHPVTPQSLFVIVPSKVMSPISGTATDSSYICRCSGKGAQVLQFSQTTIMAFLGHTTKVLVV